MTPDCPRCGAATFQMSPFKDAKEKTFGCTACHHSFTEGGKKVVSSKDQFLTEFKGVAEGEKTLKEVFGDKLDPATYTLLMTSMVDYGLQMWNDGYKQGTMMRTLRELHNVGETRRAEGDPVL